MATILVGYRERSLFSAHLAPYRGVSKRIHIRRTLDRDENTSPYAGGDCGAKWGKMASMGVAKCRVDFRGVAVFGLFGLRQSATRAGVEGAGRQGERGADDSYALRALSVAAHRQRHNRMVSASASGRSHIGVA